MKMPSSPSLPHFGVILDKWQQATVSTKAISVLALATTTSLAAFLAGYRDWKSLGPGGFPDNFKGYWMNLYLIATTAYWDKQGAGFYDKLEKKHEQWKDASAQEKENVKQSYLKGGPLPQRGGKRSRAKAWIVPQREKKVGEAGECEVREACFSALNDLAARYDSSTEWKLSAMEKRGDALFLKAFLSPPSLALQTTGEICHIHKSDLSGHVTLSFTDAKEVIAKGWGERHGLSGTKFVNAGYTMLYSPKNSDEVEILVRIFEAGIEYMRSNHPESQR